MKLDDAEYYFLDFTTALPNEAGAIPMAFFVDWAASAGLLSDAFAADLEASRRAGRSTVDYLFDRCDGKLDLGGFAGAAQRFVLETYGDGYIEDYVAAFALPDASNDALCAVAYGEVSPAALHAALDRRLDRFRALPAELQRMPEKLTPAGVSAGMKALLLPELARDGFRLVTERANGVDLVFERRHGAIDQQIRYMIHSARSDTGVAVGFHAIFGGEKLRRVWIGLLDARHRQAPPDAYARPYHAGFPELRANEFNLPEENRSGGLYLSRFAGRADLYEQAFLAHYREEARPRLATADSYRGLCALALTEMQRIRLANHIATAGGLVHSELLARIVLLAAYTDELQPGKAPDVAQQLIAQRTGDRLSDKDAFPGAEELQRLIDTVRRPEIAAKIRWYLDN